MDYKIEDKYQSMLRSYERLNKINTDNGPKISNTEARDASEDFFNQAYHFKDWLKKDGRVILGVEDFINNSKALSLAADFCNSFKHGGLDSRPARSGYEIDRVNTHVNIDFTPTGPVTSSRLEITINNASIDALALAKDCIAEWNLFLDNNELQSIK